MTPSQQTAKTHWLRATVLIAVGLVLVWQVITRSLAAHLAVAAPETALRLHPTDPRALLSLAEAKLNLDQAGRSARPAAAPGKTAPDAEASDRLRLWAELASRTMDQSPGNAGGQGKSSSQPRPSPASGPDPQTIDRVRAWATLALYNDPLNARALRILGQVAAASADEARVSRFMRAAARGSLRESLAVYWLMRKSLESRDYATALYSADALLRTRSQVAQYVMPTLLQLAENRTASGELKTALLANPPWRSQFLATLAGKATDARMPLELLLAFKDTRSPPTAADLQNYLGALIARKDYELAYYAWLQFLPPEQLRSAGFLFNGGFELPPSGLPFDWVIHAGAGVTVDIADRPDRSGQRALLIAFGHGRVEFHGVSQLTMLAPGTYRFNGTYRGEIVGKRGLVWRIACAGAPGVPIGESAMSVGASPRWKHIEFTFTVPETDCRAQNVRLELDARMASEQLVSGSIWYDELRVARVAESERP